MLTVYRHSAYSAQTQCKKVHSAQDAHWMQYLTWGHGRPLLGRAGQTVLAGGAGSGLLDPPQRVVVASTHVLRGNLAVQVSGILWEGNY